jgi:hypothetical protein
MEQELEVHQAKEESMLDDIERRSTPETNHWEAREDSIAHHFQINMSMNEDGEWNGLYVVVDRKDLPLPKELDQSFTSAELAIKACTAYIDKQKLGKETNTND